MNRLDSRWTRGLKGKDKAEFEEYLRNATQLFTRLKELIEERENEIYMKEASEDDYAVSDWENLQAHRNGRKQELRIMKKLCEHIE
jgi:hypothetical protein